MVSNLPVVWTRCHSTLSPSLSSRSRPNAPKPANPPRLNSIASEVYPRKGGCQTHFSYPCSFQRLSLEEWPFYSMRIVESPGTRWLPRHRYAESCSRLHLGVTLRRAQHENMPTIEAGNWLGVSSLTGKHRIRFESNLIGLSHARITFSWRSTEGRAPAADIPARSRLEWR